MQGYAPASACKKVSNKIKSKSKKVINHSP
jgi:hypothetical protein